MQTDTLTLQWVKGDKIGSVETVISQDPDWTTFEGGGRIATSIINEFMAPVEGEPLNLNEVQIVPSLQTERVEIKQKSENPIQLLLSKQRNQDSINLHVTFEINIPPKALFDIISTSFDEVEVVKELNTFILKQIKEDAIKDAIKVAINNVIKDKYNYTNF